MTPQDLQLRIETITGRAESALDKAVTTAQRDLLHQMQAMLAKLDLDPDGLIKQSASNRKILQKAEGIFDKAMKGSGYYESLGQYTGAIDALTVANEKYFNFILDSFSVDAHYLKSLQRNSISTIENLLANDGLEVQLKRPLMDILNQNVNSGASFSDLLKQVREFIIGSPDREGKLMRYSKQISRDSLFNFSASMQEAISENAGLEFYQYLGGAMDDTRSFCAARSNQYFHRTEVEGWASLSWAGKRAGTTKSSIYIYRGGYNCGHSLVPVSESVVPESVKERVSVK